MPPGSVPLFRADDPKISAYLAHLVHVGDEMAAGLGALFAEKFPEVPALAVIHEGFQFSKNDSLLLFALRIWASSCTCTRWIGLPRRTTVCCLGTTLCTRTRGRRRRTATARIGRRR